VQESNHKASAQISVEAMRRLFFDVAVPESLQPENLDRILARKQPRMQAVRGWGRYAAAAAAVLFIAATLYFALPVFWNRADSMAPQDADNDNVQQEDLQADSEMLQEENAVADLEEYEPFSDGMLPDQAAGEPDKEAFPVAPSSSQAPDQRVAPPSRLWVVVLGIAAGAVVVAGAVVLRRRRQKS
jgi:hypothetical protein